MFFKNLKKKKKVRGTWVSQLVKCPTSAQITNSSFVSSSPMSGCVLTTQNLKPALDSVSPPISDPPLLMPCLCLSVSKINIT